MTRGQALIKARKLWGSKARVEQRKPYTNKRTGKASPTHSIGYVHDGPIPMFFVHGQGMNWEDAWTEAEKEQARIDAIDRKTAS